jgi:predicted Zn-dependent protease
MNKNINVNWLVFKSLLIVWFAMTSIAAAANQNSSLLLKDQIEIKDEYLKNEIDRTYRFYQKRPNNYSLCKKLGKLYSYADAPQAALKWYKAAIELAPSQAEKKELVKIIQNLGSSKEAYKLLKSLPEDSNESADSILLKAQLSEDSGKPAQAAKYYFKAYRKTKNTTHLRAAAERYSWASMPKQSLRAYEILGRYKRKNKSFFLKLSELSEWAGNTQKALIYLKKAYNLAPSQALEKKIAEKYYQFGKPNEAISAYENLLKKRKNNISLKARLAQLHMETGNTSRALTILENFKPASLTPDRQYLRAQARFYSKKFRPALKDIMELFGTNFPAQNPAIAFQATILGSRAADAIKDEKLFFKYVDLAEKVKKHLSKLDKTELVLRAEFLKLQALKHLKGKFHGLAEVAYREVLKLQPDDIEAMTGLAEILKGNKNYKEASTLLERVFMLEPDSIFVNQSLAECYLELDKPWKAEYHLENIKQASAQSEYFKYLTLKSYKENKSWRKIIAATYNSKMKPTDPNFSLLIEALLNTGRKHEASKLMLKALEYDPFNTFYAKKLQEQEKSYPDYYQSFLTNKSLWETKAYNNLIASLTKKLESDPANLELKYQRAQTNLWATRPHPALKDFEDIFLTSPENIKYLKEGIETAEWAGNFEVQIKMRKKLRELEPQNATNTLRLAAELALHEETKESIPLFEEVENHESIERFQFILAAFYPYLSAGKFKSLKNVLTDIKVPVARKVTKSEKDSFKTINWVLGRLVGPVSNVKFSSFSDSSDIDTTKVDWYSKFDVHNNNYKTFELTDYSMNLKNNRSFKGQTIKAKFVKEDINRNIDIGLAAMRNAIDNENHLYLPSIKFELKDEQSNSVIEFDETPVDDTPMAMRDNISYKKLAISHFRPLKNDFVGYAYIEKGKMSTGHQKGYMDLSISKVLQRGPYRALRYSYSIENSDSENDPRFYLEDYLHNHQLSWIGEYYYHLRNSILYFDWELYAGITGRNVGFRGFVFNIEAPLRRQIFWKLSGNNRNSSSERQPGSQSYNYWDYSLALEWRGW